MQGDSIQFREIVKLLVNKGNVSFNAFDYSTRKGGFLVPLDYYHEDLVDVISFEAFLDVVEKDTADVGSTHQADYDVEKALYLDINATESYYQATMDLWFPKLEQALEVAEQLDINADDIYDITNNCFINEDEE